MGYKSPGQILFYVTCANFSPADATDYFWADMYLAADTLFGTYQLQIPGPMRIRKAFIRLMAGGATGTNEDISLYIRVNDATDYFIATVSTATTNRDFRNNDMNVPLTGTDLICIKMVSPTWVTNPVNLRCYGWLLAEAE